MGIQERKQRERERRRQQIIIAAKRVFSEKGFNKATIEDIAKEAELSPGTLYLYFKNKEELYASLSIRILQYLNIRVDHVNKEKDLTPSEKLTALMKSMFDVYDFDPMTIINMFHLQSSETLKNLSTELMSDIKELSRKSLAGIAAIFREGIEQGDFIDTVQNLDGVKVHMIKLAAPDGSSLELLKDESHPTPPPERNRMCDRGIRHIAFTVGDIQEAWNTMRQHGCEVLSSPVTSPDGKARLFFARDPEGNLLEIVEVLSTS